MDKFTHQALGYRGLRKAEKHVDKALRELQSVSFELAQGDDDLVRNYGEEAQFMVKILEAVRFRLKDLRIYNEPTVDIS